MKVDAYPMLKTILFTLENGKNLPNGIRLLAQSARKKAERKAYERIEDTLQNGESFSTALQHHCVCPMDVVHFVSMAEKGLNFKEALRKVIHYLDVKQEFRQESSDKVTVPTIYFVLATLVVFVVKFFAVPYQIERSKAYSAEIMDIVGSHLLLAQLFSNLLLVGLILVAGYFFIFLIALFSNSRFWQAFAKAVALRLPFARHIVMQFEKFVTFSMLGQMLQSGIGLKQALGAAVHNSSTKLFSKSFERMLEQMRTQGQLQLPDKLFDAVEQNLLRGVGSNVQLGQSFLQIADKARFEALNESKRFFRMVTMYAIFLMAFAVFVEFYVVVLTQILLQKGLVDLAGSGAIF